MAGTVQRSEQRVIMVNLGPTEAIMLPQDQIPGESFAQGQRIKCYICEERNLLRDLR